jgi:NhaA family Na+:H+ antiporter
MVSTHIRTIILREKKMSEIPKKVYRTLKNPPVLRISSPLQRFIKKEASGSRVLIICIFIGLLWINLPFGDSYVNLWNTHLSFSIGSYSFNQSILHWINDGLMAIFFFLIGLELKRELVVGGLTDLKEASLSIVAAIGGMVIPAVIYLTLNHPNSTGIKGWGIPMSTDIAISLGILILFSYHIPRKLKILLTSIAIIDDLGAIIIIAFFYSGTIKWQFLIVSLAIFGILLLFNKIGIRNNVLYIIPGIILWFCVFQSGIHATLTGVLLASTIPATKRMDLSEFHDLSKRILGSISEIDPAEGDVSIYTRYISSIHALEVGFKNIQTPLEIIEDKLINWTAFLIVPLFGLANSGISLKTINTETFSITIFLGVFLGLLIGKPIGLILFSWLYTKTKLVKLPTNVNWLQMSGIGFLAGIGFTMSNFIAGLAFSSETALLDSAKIGILSASIIAAILGYIILRSSIKKRISKEVKTE